MYKYALTIKYLLNDIDCHYETAIAILQRIHYFDVVWTTHEKDKNGRIHIHSLVITNRKIFVPRMNLKGYTVCIRPIIYERGWHDYAHKEIYGMKNLIVEQFNTLGEKTVSLEAQGSATDTGSVESRAL